MIQIKMNKNDEYFEVTVKGHAGFANYGNDIVCAAVSVALIMTGNLLLKYNDGYNVLDLKSEEGHFNLKVKLDKCSLLICDNLEDTLAEIARQYPKNVKFNG